MKRLTITIEKQTQLAKGILPLPVFWIYNTRMSGVFALIRRSLKDYIIHAEPDKIIASQEGDDDYIFQQEEDWKKFIFGDKKEISEEEEFKKLMSIRGLGKLTRAIKERGLRGLGDNLVHGFLAKVGITTSWKVEDVKQPC